MDNRETGIWSHLHWLQNWGAGEKTLAKLLAIYLRVEAPNHADLHLALRDLNLSDEVADLDRAISAIEQVVPESRHWDWTK